MYIVFEGIVGAGKSTQAKRLAGYLSSGREIIQVREPGSTPIAEDIRHLAQGKEWEEVMHPLTNAYLYAAARAQTLHTIVKPALEEGKTIVSDRSFLSSLAYQGEAQGLGFDTILSVNQDAVKDILPDIIFLMDLDIDTALSRTFDADGDKWESMGKEFFEKIAVGYEKCEKLDLLKNKIVRIDASGNEDEIFDQIKSALIPKKLLQELKEYDTRFQNENSIGKKFLMHIDTYGIAAFENDHWNEGHITGSMLITNTRFDKVLLTKHKKLSKWLQFGGHSDGSCNMLSVAIREFKEESGISQTPKIYNENGFGDFSIFDLDIHDLPPDKKRSGPEHKHFDIRFLGVIDEDAPFEKQDDEVDDIAWFHLDEAQSKIEDKSLLRMIDKLQKINKK